MKKETSLPLTLASRPHSYLLHTLLMIWLLLGGTNLRVCLVTLGNGQFELTQAKYRLTEEQKQADGQELFDFCAECLQTFLKSQVEEGYISLKEGATLPLGFTVGLCR